MSIAKASSKIAPKVRLDSKTVIVTGCNTGIGKITALVFFQRGAKVIMACRSLERAQAAADEIKKECQNQSNTGQLIIKQLELSSLESVRQFSKTILDTEQRIDLLVNNAGVMLCPYQKTEDGFEMQFGTNHLGHFLLTLLLLPKIVKSTPARIVNVSSLAHEKGKIHFDDINYEKRKYNPSESYRQSKLANVLFTKELARRIEEANIKGLTTYSLHPGVINTELDRHLDEVYFRGASWFLSIGISVFGKTVDQGSMTNVYCSLDESIANDNGLYYSDCKAKKPAPAALKMDDAKKLWDVSLEMVGLEDNYDPFKQ